MRKTIPVIAALLISAGCASLQGTEVVITDYDSCVKAGNRVLRSYPPKCVTMKGETFTKIIPPSGRGREVEKVEPVN